jgi:hypothetical protein
MVRLADRVEGCNRQKGFGLSPEPARLAGWGERLNRESYVKNGRACNCRNNTQRGLPEFGDGMGATPSLAHIGGAGSADERKEINHGHRYIGQMGEGTGWQSIL